MSNMITLIDIDGEESEVQEYIEGVTRFRLIDDVFDDDEALAWIKKQPTNIMIVESFDYEDWRVWVKDCPFSFDMSEIVVIDDENDNIDCDETGVILEEESSVINMSGLSISEVLGLHSEDSRQLVQSVKFYDGDLEIYKDLYDYSSLMRDSIKKGMLILPIFDCLSKDIFLTLFKENPEIVAESRMRESCRINNKLIRKLVETKEYRDIRQFCKLNLLNSSLGIEVIGRRAITLIQEFKDELQEKLQMRIDNGEYEINDVSNMDISEIMLMLKGSEDKVDELIDELEELTEEDGTLKQGVSINDFTTVYMELNVAKEIADKASEKIKTILDDGDENLFTDLTNMFTGTYDEAEDIIADTTDLIGAWGLTSENDKVRIPFNEKRKAVERIRGSQKLMDLTKLIGKFKSSAITFQKKKTKDNMDAIKSIETGSKIDKVLPSEKMLLCNNVTKKDFYRKYNQKELLQYELNSNKQLTQGPIITCIDTSQSMAGQREKWSKSVAIAMLEIAHYQHRDYAAILYSNYADKPIVIDKDIIEPMKILDIAEVFHNGGTDFEEPLERALELIKSSKFRKADIVFITDGECSLGSRFLDKFNKIKKDKDFKVMTICINIGRNSSIESLKEFSDEVIMLSNLAELNNPNSKISEQIFSGV